MGHGKAFMEEQSGTVTQPHFGMSARHWHLFRRGKNSCEVVREKEGPGILARKRAASGSGGAGRVETGVEELDLLRDPLQLGAKCHLGLSQPL